jgi:histidinol-phosphate aminotransferase
VNFYPDGAATLLRERLARHWNLAPEQFVIGNGSNEVMILLAQTFLLPGDEVVFGKEAFIVYKLAALLFGAKPVAVPMPAWTHDLAAMRAAITPRTKLVFLACPNNPTGTINSAAEILAFARSLPEHVVLCLDEAYTEFLEESAAADIRPLIAEGVKIVGARTFSKIYGLAGLRVGYLYGSAELAGLVQRSRQPFNVNLVAQAAAVAALEGPQDMVETMRQAFSDRRRYMVERINGLNGVSCKMPKGAFYVMMNISELFGKTLGGKPIGNSDEFCDVLLEQAKVALVPGSGFGADGYVRWSYATSQANIQEGLDRLEKFLNA